MESTSSYNFNLFRPLTNYSKKNRNMILTMLAIWAVGVFGFQILLKVLEKPTPEKTLIMFNEAWPDRENGSFESKQKLLRAMVLTNGKTVIKPDDRKVLNAAISALFFSMTADSTRTSIETSLVSIQDLKIQKETAKDQEYLDIKQKLDDLQKQGIAYTGPVTGFPSGSLEETILVSSLKTKSEDMPDLTALPALMEHYLTHNQSVLTDSVFLGFPFHYFYTAVFLLIMFVVLCLVYNILLNRRQKLEGIDE